MTVALSVDSVSKYFGGVAAVDRATFDVQAASLTAVIGPNGAGKSTLFNVISGYLSPDRGAVFVEGQRVTGRSPERIARLGLVRTFQLTKAFAPLTVLENLVVAAPAHPGETLRGLVRHPIRTRRYERAARVRALELLEVFGLSQHAESLAGQLSGGQRKLLELCRALMLEPRVLLLDEPLAGVNPTVGNRIMAHVSLLRDSVGVTTLFVEHDLPAVMRYSDEIVVMAEGAVISQGSPTLIRSDDRVISAYFGTTAS